MLLEELVYRGAKTFEHSFEIVTHTHMHTHPTTTKLDFAKYSYARAYCPHCLKKAWKIHKMNKDTQIEKKCMLSSTHWVSQSHNQFLGVWKAACSVWHQLLSANSTLGDALASFAANPGKEITDTHNAAFYLSAKKKTSPLSPQKKVLLTNSHSLSPILVQNQRIPFVSRNMASNVPRS